MNLETLSEKIYSRRRLRFGAHVLFWLCELLLTWYTTVISFNAYRNMDDGVIWRLSIVNTLNLMLFYYPLVYLIIPQLKNKKYLISLLGIVGLLLLYSLISTLAEKLLLLRCEPCMQLLKVSNNDYYQFLQRNLPNRLFAKIATLGVMIGLAFSISVPLVIKIALQSFRQQIAAIKLAKENVELEFNFLKSQVNPHFLFNSLNNIFGLILKKENAIAAETVARLAEFMRYTLHSSDSDRMPLQKEVQLLSDYIDLEKIRLNHTSVTFDLRYGRDDRLFPSLLLVPLIENAFKYSADRSGAAINIQLNISKNKLNLEISNTIDENRRLNAAGGIGLQNLKKRLKLYYPGNYNYKFTDTGQLYTTNLEIKL